MPIASAADNHYHIFKSINMPLRLHNNSEKNYIREGKIRECEKSYS